MGSKSILGIFISFFFFKHPRSYDSGYRRAPNPKYNKRNDNRSASGKQFQGTYQGPTKTFNKNNNQKYASNQSGNGYENTPLKETTGKSSYQHAHSMSKRDQSMIDNDNSNGNMGFGSNVPPFPYFDANEQHFVPPGNGNLTI